MKITFVTDYVCPYCIVGKAALKQAAKELGIELVIDTYPMELTVEPEERVDTWHDEHRKENYKVLIGPAESLGLDAKFPPYVVPRPYTRLAFEGHYMAEKYGLEDVYDDAMYRAYFVDEKDIGQIEVLADVAESVGLDREEYRKSLEEGIYTKVEKEADTYSKTVLDVHSVPTMIIKGERVQFEDYSVEDAKRILTRFL